MGFTILITCFITIEIWKEIHSNSLPSIETIKGHKYIVMDNILFFS